ncbi:hypothetical protein Psp6_00006 [Pseudomonas phage Psp6]|nr:hypothetical protein Psp6_00006 [Pseudomonas phage Psp6]
MNCADCNCPLGEEHQPPRCWPCWRTWQSQHENTETPGLSKCRMCRIPLNGRVVVIAKGDSWCVNCAPLDVERIGTHKIDTVRSRPWVKGFITLPEYPKPGWRGLPLAAILFAAFVAGFWLAFEVFKG